MEKMHAYPKRNALISDVSHL